MERKALTHRALVVWKLAQLQTAGPRYTHTSL